MSRRLSKGILIAFEGIDGAGKTTQAKALAAALGEAGLDTIYTKEPTDGPWGQRIRESSVAGRMSPEEELHAFIEDRREHVRDVIQPALDRGRVVVVDRYYLSSVAYQGARGLDPWRILRENEEFAPVPELVFLLVVKPEEGMRRVRGRGRANLFEQEQLLRDAASVFARLDLPYLRRLEGTLPVESLEATVRQYVDPILGIRGTSGRTAPPS